MSAEMTSGEPATRATLAEVAALADVSISTVSKVLNGRSGVSEDTRARIEALLQDHQYNRRSPGPNHAPLIEVLCFEIDSSWAAEAIAAIERLAREHGVGVVVSGTNDRQKPDLDWIEGVLNRRPVGVILVVCSLLDAQKRQLRSRNIPFVMVDPRRTTGSGRTLDRLGRLEWGVRRDAAPDRARPSRDRDHHRARGHDGGDGPAVRLPRRAGGRRAFRSARSTCGAESSTTATASPRDARSSPCRFRRPRSSPPPTSRRSAFTRRRGPSGSPSPRSCLWSDSTTSRSPGGRDRPSPRSASPLPRWRSRPRRLSSAWRKTGHRHSRAVEMATTLVVRDSTDVPPRRSHESFVHKLET